MIHLYENVKVEGAAAAVPRFELIRVMVALVPLPYMSALAEDVLHGENPVATTEVMLGAYPPEMVQPLHVGELQPSKDWE